MNRFIAKLRLLPPQQEDYYFDGWTSEGALTKRAYREAFYSSDWPEIQPNENSSDAEWNEQVQITPSLDEIHDFVRKPLVLPPLPEAHKLLENIKFGMKQQAMASGVTDVTALQLPEDLEVLYSTVKGIIAAGVPTEHCYTTLVNASGLFYPPTEMSLDISIYGKESFGKTAIAALRLGGCEQHRSIHYVLRQPVNDTEISPEARWQIWDRVDIEIAKYDNLADWLLNETKVIEETEGGAGWDKMVLPYV